MQINNDKIVIAMPVYNGERFVKEAIESVLSQTYSNLEIIVIDDGSIDNTKELIEEWQKENKIHIDYIYKENGGMHTGHNVAYSHITSELNVCIDSDDFMPDNAVDIILSFWNNNDSDESIAGIVGLDIYKNGEIIGTPFPLGIKAIQ